MSRKAIIITMTRPYACETHDQIHLYNEMKKALHDHNSYFVRKKYYPHNMDAWEEEYRDIEMEYRTRIRELTCKEKKVDKENNEREELLQAAEGLLKLKRSTRQRKTNNKTPLRRSSRIASMHKNEYY